VRLNAINLEQWRCFDDCSLEFPDGIIGVRGFNGAGKTTLVEAISWALFGKVRAGRREGLSINDLKRQDRPAGARSAVTLWFQLGGVQHRVERVVSGSAKLWIGDDPEPETTQTTATNRRLVQELGVNWDMFTRTTFAQQKEVAALSATWSAADRRTHVERLLGLGRYTRAAEAARAEVRRMTAELSGRRESAPDLSELVAALREAEAAAASSDPATTTAKTAADAAKAALDAAEERVRAEQGRRDEADLLQQRLEALREALGEGHPRAERLRETVAQHEQNVARSAELDGAADRDRRLASELAAWDRLQAAERSLEQARERLDALAFDPDALTALRTAVERLTVEQEELSAGASGRRRRIEEAEARLEALMAVADAGPVEDWLAQKDAIDQELGDVSRQAAVVDAELAHDRTHLEAVEAGGPDTPCPVCRKPYGETYEEILAGYRERIATNSAAQQALADRAAGLRQSLAQVAAAYETARDAARKLAQTSGLDDIDEARREAAAARDAEAEAAARHQTVTTELAKARTAFDELRAAEAQDAAERRQVKSCELALAEALAATGCDSYSEPTHADVRRRREAAAADATELTTLAALIETHRGAAAEFHELEERLERLDGSSALRGR
jgi:DNA repair protein SbcC/Rad50